MIPVEQVEDGASCCGVSDAGPLFWLAGGGGTGDDDDDDGRHALVGRFYTMKLTFCIPPDEYYLYSNLSLQAYVHFRSPPFRRDCYSW